MLLGAEDSRPAATVSIGGGDPAAAWTLDVCGNQLLPKVRATAGRPSGSPAAHRRRLIKTSGHFGSSNDRKRPETLIHQNQQIMQPWLQGLNPILGEQSPARLLRDGELEQDGPRVLDAARAFAADA
ncbi:MAG TPA: hypothetical protein VES60_05550 [Nakamurella sp.]|nr:hypothetical protein [Nakamurella sp.]